MKKCTAVFILALIVLACEKNNPPQILNVLISPSERKVGTLFLLTADVDDEDLSSIDYAWSADGGTFTEAINGKQTKWMSPLDGSNKTYNITIKVTDKEYSAIKSVQIKMDQEVCGSIHGNSFYSGTKIPVQSVRIKMNDLIIQTDANGFFIFNSIPVGTYELEATKDGFDKFLKQIIVVENVATELLLPLTSTTQTSKVSGLVKDQEGLPIFNANVVVLNPDGSESTIRTSTDQDGYYELSGVPQVEVTFSIKVESTDEKRFEPGLVKKVIAVGSNSLDFVIFKTVLSGSFEYSGRNYKWKIIGSQTWMVENLAYIPAVSIPTWYSEKEPAYYIYGNYSMFPIVNENINYLTYGVLYNWPAALKACPSGWHLPNENDWKALEKYLGEDSAGKKMKEEGTVHWPYNNTGTNESGFSAIPGGYFLPDKYWHMGSCAVFWSADQYGDISTSAAYSRLLFADKEKLFTTNDYKSTALSVRCIKNQ